MLKVMELFAGYGSQALALENLGIELYLKFKDHTFIGVVKR